MDADDFLDQIHFRGNVKSVTRSNDLPAELVLVNGQPESFENARDNAVFHVQSQQQRKPGPSQRDRIALRQMRVCYLVHEGACFTSRYLEQQFSCAFDCARLPFEINSAFEPQGRIGVHPVGACATSHESLRPERRFEKDVGGLATDRGAQAAHYPGEADGATIVSDYQGVVVDDHFLFVEQSDFFALLRQPRTNGSLDEGGIVGMQGLTEFEHHVVGDIDHRRNAAQTGAPQAL